MNNLLTLWEAAYLATKFTKIEIRSASLLKRNTELAYTKGAMVYLMAKYTTLTTPGLEIALNASRTFIQPRTRKKHTYDEAEIFAKMEWWYIWLRQRDLKNNF